MAASRDPVFSERPPRSPTADGRFLETSPDGLITRARVESAESEPGYLRVSVVDAAGRKAWTNPL
jgi:hypothetical protein